jgi:hypothetical protein
MSLDIRTHTFQFGPHTGSPQSDIFTFEFPTSVQNAASAISGFNIKYTGGDHHLGQEQIQTFVNIHGNVGQFVDVSVGFLLRDSSGNIDDAFDGSVDVMLIVDR